MLFGEERRPAEPADYACERISPATVADDRGDCVYTLFVRRCRGISWAGQTRSPRFATLWVGNHANPPMPAGRGRDRRRVAIGRRRPLPETRNRDRAARPLDELFLYGKRPTRIRDVAVTVPSRWPSNRDAPNDAHP
jgi:hypothetical protein